MHLQFVALGREGDCAHEQPRRPLRFVAYRALHSRFLGASDEQRQMDLLQVEVPLRQTCNLLNTL
jgi:hypothetical protein